MWKIQHKFKFPCYTWNLEFKLSWGGNFYYLDFIVFCWCLVRWLKLLFDTNWKDRSCMFFRDIFKYPSLIFFFQPEQEQILRWGTTTMQTFMSNTKSKWNYILKVKFKWLNNEQWIVVSPAMSQMVRQQRLILLEKPVYLRLCQALYRTF